MKKAIKEHPDVYSFENKFRDAFGDFDDYLYDELIEKMEPINISKAEAALSADIFERLKDIPLVDKYEAYQLLDDDWKKISVDLEIIQTEGFEATKVLTPIWSSRKRTEKIRKYRKAGQAVLFRLI